MQSRKERLKTLILLRFIPSHAGYELEFFPGRSHPDDLAKLKNNGFGDPDFIHKGPMGAVVCQDNIVALKLK
jgi:hypothetical protein